jgi:hypothetical protein
MVVAESSVESRSTPAFGKPGVPVEIKRPVQGMVNRQKNVSATYEKSHQRKSCATRLTSKTFALSPFLTKRRPNKTLAASVRSRNNSRIAK